MIDVKIYPEYSREYSGFKKLIPKIQKVALSSHIWDTTWETVIALGRKKLILISFLLFSFELYLKIVLHLKLILIALGG